MSYIHTVVSLHKIILEVIKFAEKMSFQSLLKCINVSDGVHMQWQVIPRLRSRHVESVLSKLQACPCDL